MKKNENWTNKRKTATQKIERNAKEKNRETNVKGRKKCKKERNAKENQCRRMTEIQKE